MSNVTDQKIALIKAVMTNTLLEAVQADAPIPRSTIYMQVGMDMQLATIIQDLMTEQGWAKFTSETIVATAAGKRLVAQCEAEAAA